MSDCYCACDDPAEVFTERWRVARKAHKCCECLAEINPGERYQYCTMIYEGTASDHKTCASCAETRDEYMRLTDAECWPPFGNLGCCYVALLHEAGAAQGDK